MGQMIGNQYVPGPNDHHVDKQGLIQPGLGKDEPSPEASMRNKKASEVRLIAMRKQLEELVHQQETKDRELDAREFELSEKEERMRAKLIAAGIDPDAE
jgi:hypothetical protein